MYVTEFMEEKNANVQFRIVGGVVAIGAIVNLCYFFSDPSYKNAYVHLADGIIFMALAIRIAFWRKK